MRAVRFVTATRAGAGEFRSKPIYQSLAGRYDLYVRLNNTYGLPKINNLFLDGSYEGFQHYGPNPGFHAEDDIVVFIHDDVEMLGNNVEAELNRWADQGYGLMGLAGGSNAVIREPALWHLMTPNGHRSGVSIFHYHHHLATGGMVEMREFPHAAKFGPLGDVDLLDGLFLALVTDEAKRVGLRFDEQFEFHHYDLSLSLDARSAGLKVRTVFVPVTHGSPGLMDMHDPIFKSSERKFLSKYRG